MYGDGRQEDDSMNTVLIWITLILLIVGGIFNTLSIKAIGKFHDKQLKINEDIIEILKRERG